MNQEFTINDEVFPMDGLHETAIQKAASLFGTEREIWLLIAEWTNQQSFIEAHTSGSTGEPKRIQLAKDAVRKSAQMSALFFGLNEASSALLCLPPAYIAGKMIVIRCLVNGWHLRWTEPSLNPLHDYTGHADTVSLTPMQVSKILQDSPDALNRFSVVLIGGGALPASTEEALKQFPIRMYETYGMTETITHIAVREIHSENRVFQALPGVRVKKDERSCLVILAEHLGSEPIITNDIVDIVDEEHFIYRGRFDSMINSGGIKLYPEELEKRIAHLLHAPFIFQGMKDDFYGEKLVLCIEKKSITDEEKNFILKDLRKVLGSYEMPKEIIAVPQIARTPSGKPIRRSS